MLIRLRIENYRSLRDEQQLSFVAQNLSDSAECLMTDPALDESILPVLAIYGANASGKSNVLKALHFMETAVMSSQRHWDPEGGIPVEPFLMDSSAANKPSLFEVDLLLDGTRYTYGFVSDSRRILEEWLYAYPKGRQQKWFVRDADGRSEYKFGRELVGENSTIRKLTRPNSLFLSAAAQNNHEMLKPVYDWFRQGMYYLADRNAVRTPSVQMVEDSSGHDSLVKLLQSADLGVTDVQIVRESLPELSIRVAELLANQDPTMLARLKKDPTFPTVTFRHQSSDANGPVLSFDDESRGTQVLFVLGGYLLSALATGSLLFVDELDSSLHPLIALELVRLFNNRETNPHRAQLLFNTHDTNLLESSALRRDQIWFTEKDKTGATHLYPLTDFQARKQENLKRGYLQGRYGAVPFIGSLTHLSDLVGIDA